MSNRETEQSSVTMSEQQIGYRRSRKPWPIVLELISLIGLALCVLIPKLVWQTLPDRVPRHFGFSGKPDAWDGKGDLLSFAGISVLFYGILTAVGWLTRLTKLMPENLTQEQKDMVREFSYTAVRWVKVLCIWTMAFLQLQTVRIALGRTDRLGSGNYLFIIGTGVFIIWVVIGGVKLNRAGCGRR
jgi:uncharacterized membrane protein